MSNVRRVYVEKKPEFAVKAKELKAEVRNYLGIKTIRNVRVLIRYDIENISEETYRKAHFTVFSEPPVDDIFEETFACTGAHVFSVEFLPGQFDQRADSAEQCVKLLNETEEPIIRSATTYVLEGELTEEEQSLVRRARNRKITSMPRNVAPITYKWATAFEAFVGYLHLTEQKERLEWFIERVISIINYGE